ncbi:MAG TPA: hypothetical protein VK698_36965 [Kofleriaceae bacterium]|nr:hypothetical protein [Kofleriaceae bacterium]
MEAMKLRPIRNVHVRRLAAPIERVVPWIESCWTGGDRDCFPRDVIPNWRKNPHGADPLALIPGETLVGHGPFRFRLRVWDGRVWRVDVVGGGLVGWHGFDLEPDGDGCRVTHTLELEGTISARLSWMTLVPIHDWAVEAMFDRLEHALRTGVAPRRTERPMPRMAALSLGLARVARSRRPVARPSTSVG